VDVVNDGDFTEQRDTEEEPFGLYFVPLERNWGTPRRQRE